MIASSSLARSLPVRLRRALESLSGFDMSDVRICVDSDLPAAVGARAFACGTEIHLGPGAQGALAHEAWHVVQQKQGRVKARRGEAAEIPWRGRVGVNGAAELEAEADAMGALALAMSESATGAVKPCSPARVRVKEPVIQRLLSVEGTGFAMGGVTALKEAMRPHVGDELLRLVLVTEILEDLITEDRTFATWAALEKEVRIRYVGYEAEAAMRALMEENRPKYEKAEEAIEKFRSEQKRESDELMAYVDEQLADVLTWSEPSSIHESKTEFQLLQWLAGERKTDPKLMNCWEAVCYSLIKSGLASKGYIGWGNRAFITKTGYGGMAKPTYFSAHVYANAEIVSYAREFERETPVAKLKWTPPVELGTKKMFWVPPDFLIPRGRILMFGLDGDHFALSTGKLCEIRDIKARTLFGTTGHGMLELDGRHNMIRERALEEITQKHYKARLIVAPFPPGSAASTLSLKLPFVITEEMLASQQELIRRELEPEYAAKIAKAKKEAADSIVGWEKSGSPKAPAAIEKAKKRRDEQVEAYEKGLNARIETTLRKWREKQSKLSGEARWTIPIGGSDPYGGKVDLPIFEPPRAT